MQSIIERTQELDCKLILKGADDGLEGVRDGVGWTIVIVGIYGSLVLKAS